MITIIIGICLIVLSYFMVKKRIGKWWMSFLLIMIGMFVIVFGIAAPINGYNEYVSREEISLSSIAVDEKNNNDIYIIELENGDKVYKGIDEEKGKEFKVYDKSIKVEIIEEENCKQPKLVYYFRPIKSSVFSLGMMTLGDKYTFYIPKGSMIK